MVNIKLADQYRDAGRACERVCDNSGAIRNYQLALNENPDDLNSMANLAWVMHKEGNTPSAKSLIDRVCEAKPDKRRFVDLKERIYREIKRLDVSY